MVVIGEVLHCSYDIFLETIDVFVDEGYELGAEGCEMGERELFLLLFVFVELFESDSLCDQLFYRVFEIGLYFCMHISDTVIITMRVRPRMFR